MVGHRRVPADVGSDFGSKKQDRSSLLRTLCQSDDVELIATLSKKGTKNWLEEDLESLPAKELQTSIAAMHRRVTAWLQVLQADDVPSPYGANENTPDAEEGQPDSGNNGEVKETARQGLAAAVSFARSALHISQVNGVPQELTAMVIALHNELMQPTLQHVHDAVEKLCFDYWCAQAPMREHVSVQLVMVMLCKAIDGRAADVKRCHALRDALKLFDLEDEGSLDLVELLMRAAMSPSFLRCAEGRRFLATLFHLTPDLILDLTAVLRNQIVAGRPSLLDAYAEVLFKAWRDITDDLRDVMEQECIQELMQSAILASSPHLAASLRRVLRGFHDQKSIKGVDAMLHRLFEPILWRHMRAAHPEVRSNALALLYDAFPIQDPALTNEQIEESLTKQLTLMKDALRDPAPKVRQVATSGVCMLLNSWWELLPAQTVSHFMVLLQDSAFDSAAPMVRIALLEGLADLINNPRAQKPMEVMLPHLRPLMFDPNVRVRQAMASLLERVGRLRGLKWWQIVPCSEVLSVLGSDAPSVIAPIQRLVIPSIFPRMEDGALELAACAELMQVLRDNPAAGTTFCKLLVTPTSDGDAAPAIPTETLQALSRTMLGYLLDCDITYMKQATKSAPAEPAQVEADDGGDVDTAGDGDDTDPEVLEESEAQGQRKRKAPAVAGPAGDEHVEDAAENVDSWNALMSGVQELLSGTIEQLRRQCEAAQLSHEAEASKRKGAKPGKSARAAANKQPKAAASTPDFIALLNELLPDGSLTALIERAPSIQGVRSALKVVRQARGSRAAAEVADVCVAWIAQGAVTLPGVHACRSKGSLVINLNALPLQGKVHGAEGERVDFLCEMMSMLLDVGRVDAMLSLICPALEAVEALPAAGAVGRKGDKQTIAIRGSLQASGALAVLAMLLKADGGSQACALSTHSDSLVSAVAGVMERCCITLCDASGKDSANSVAVAPMLPQAVAALQRLCAARAAHPKGNDDASAPAQAEAGADSYTKSISHTLIQPLMQAMAADKADAATLQQACIDFCIRRTTAPEALPVALEAHAPKRRRTAVNPSGSSSIDALVCAMQIVLAEALQIADLSARADAASGTNGAAQDMPTAYSRVRVAAIRATLSVSERFAEMLCDAITACPVPESDSASSTRIIPALQTGVPMLAKAMQLLATAGMHQLDADQRDGSHQRTLAGIGSLLCCATCVHADEALPSNLRELGCAALAFATSLDSAMSADVTADGDVAMNVPARPSGMASLLGGCTLHVAGHILLQEPSILTGGEQTSGANSAAEQLEDAAEGQEPNDSALGPEGTCVGPALFRHLEAACILVAPVVAICMSKTGALRTETYC